MTDELTAKQLRDLADAVDAANAVAGGRVQYLDEPAELPPPPESEPMVMRGVRLPVSLDQQVRAAAAKAGLSFSALIREWIELGLAETEDDKTIPLSALRRAIAHAAQTGLAA
jgi:predicted DNA-binding protein